MRWMPLLLLAAGPTWAADAENGAQLFGFHCASCHGVEAKGDGPLGEMLTVPPPDLTTLMTRNAGAFPIGDVLRKVDGTVEVQGHGGPMPVFGFILDGPSEAVLTPDGTEVVAPVGLVDIATWLKSVQVE